jgi:hypothetical protein
LIAAADIGKRKPLTRTVIKRGKQFSTQLSTLMPRVIALIIAVERHPRRC